MCVRFHVCVFVCESVCVSLCDACRRDRGLDLMCACFYIVSVQLFSCVPEFVLKVGASVTTIHNSGELANHAASCLHWSVHKR